MDVFVRCFNRRQIPPHPQDKTRRLLPTQHDRQPVDTLPRPRDAKPEKHGTQFYPNDWPSKAPACNEQRPSSTLSRETADAPEWRLVGCFASECKRGELTAASPISYVDANDPQMLLIVGDGDVVVPTKQTLEMAEKLKQNGVRHQLIVLPGVSHSFIGKTDSQTREANLKALASTFEFFDKTIGRVNTR